MHSCVLGAGVIGVTTAYELLMAGHEVSLIEEQSQVAQMTSLGNGAQLSYSYVAPLADASIWKKWPEYLFSQHSPLRFKPQLDPALWHWLWQFLVACNHQRANISSRQLLTLAQISQTQIEQIRAQHGFDFQHKTSGKLVMLSDQASIDVAAAQITFQAQYGCQQSILSIAQCIELEPALAHAQTRWLAGVYTPAEEVGDCALFCQHLLAIMAQSPRFKFLPNARIESAHLVDGKVAHINLRQTETATASTTERHTADHFVVAMGIESARFANMLGFRLPVYPLKGYSITVPIRDANSASAPHISITDLSQKIVYARLGDRLRVAGRVELVGHDLRIPPKAIAELVNATHTLFPESGDLNDTQQLSPWAGLRPATPTGVPILGKSPIPNVYLNVGHGALGWTLACGSASLLRNVICGETPAIDMTGFAFR
nr:D-amino acid dehydrogenase [uncultured Undibacterium sp.]